MGGVCGGGGGGVFRLAINPQVCAWVHARGYQSLRLCSRLNYMWNRNNRELSTFFVANHAISMMTFEDRFNLLEDCRSSIVRFLRRARDFKILNNSTSTTLSSLDDVVNHVDNYLETRREYKTLDEALIEIFCLQKSRKMFCMSCIS